MLKKKQAKASNPDRVITLKQFIEEENNSLEARTAMKELRDKFIATLPLSTTIGQLYKALLQ